MQVSFASTSGSRSLVEVALVGYGYWGQNLARCIAGNGDARLAVICECSPERMAAARRDLPRVRVLADFDTVLRDPAINAIVLATPIPTRGRLALRALEHGKHVLVEKPIAGSSGEALAMAEVSNRRRLVLMVDHTYLFSPAFEAIRSLSTNRLLGPLRYYHSIRCNCFGAGHETNVLWDLAVHDVSILGALVATSPASVQTTALPASQGQSASHAQVTLTYPDRAFASVLVSWIAPSKVRTIVLGFDRHTIVWDDLVAGSRVLLFDRGLELLVDPRNLRQPHTVAESIPVAPVEPLSNAVRHFLECIATGAPPQSGTAAGVRTVRVLEAAECSLTGNGRVVPLIEGAVAP